MTQASNDILPPMWNSDLYPTLTDALVHNFIYKSGLGSKPTKLAWVKTNECGDVLIHTHYFGQPLKIGNVVNLRCEVEEFEICEGRTLQNVEHVAFINPPVKKSTKGK